MRCQYCGKENSEASIFCEGCGAKLGANEAQNMNQGYGSPNNNYNQQPKKNTGLIVTIIILSVLLVAGIIVGVILLTSSGSKNDNGNSGKGNNYTDNGNNYKNSWDDDDDYDWDDDDDYDWDDDDDDDYNYSYKKNTNDYDRDITDNGNYLSCKMTDTDGQKVDVTFKFDSTNTNLKNYGMTMSIPLDSTYKQLGDDYLESLFESTVCSTGDYDSCEISVEDDQVIIYIEVYSQSNLATYNGYSKSQLKTYMTNQGYTCN